jgi:DNA-binding transcriptional LysR family regulator
MKAVPLKALASEFFLGISEETYPGASRYVTEACAKAGFKPKIIETVERGFTILGLVAGKCGVALLPESLESLPHPGVVFRPLRNPPAGDLYFAWKSSAQSNVLRSFIESMDIIL